MLVIIDLLKRKSKDTQKNIAWGQLHLELKSLKLMCGNILFHAAVNFYVSGA